MTAIPVSHGTVSRDICERLAGLVGHETYEKHFQTAARLKFDGRSVRVQVPSQFHKKMLGRVFADPLIRAARAALGLESVDVDWCVDPGVFEAAMINEQAVRDTAEAVAPALTAPARGPSLRMRHDLSDFVVGPSNELAYSAALGLIEPDKASGFKALVMHGPSGLGKTHLLQGLAALHRQRHPGGEVRYVTGEHFVTDFVASVRAGRVDGFRSRYRGVDLLCLDDMQFLCGKKASLCELLHTMDALDLDGGRLAIVSDEHPARLETLGTRLKSRCLSSMIVRIDPPDESMRRGIVRSLAQRKGLVISEDACDSIARLHVDSARELEGILARATAIHRMEGVAGGGGGPLSETTVRRAVIGLRVGQPRRPIRPAEVLDAVCNDLGVGASEVLGGGRHHRVVVARGVAAYLLRECTTMSFPEIARALGRRNHSTVVTAAQRVARQVSDGSELECGPEYEGVTFRELCERVRRAVSRGG